MSINCPAQYRVQFKISLIGKKTYISAKPYLMTKAEYLAICSQHWDEIENLKTRDNFYDHEKDFVDIWRRTGLAVFSKSIGSPPKDHRKKNSYDLR